MMEKIKLSLESLEFIYMSAWEAIAHYDFLSKVPKENIYVTLSAVDWTSEYHPNITVTAEYII